MTIFKTSNSDRLGHLIQELEKSVKNKGSIQSDNSQLVLEISKEIAISGVNTTGCLVTEIPGVMSQVQIYKSDTLEFRANIFLSATETIVHNHSRPFISVCLDGEYTHTHFTVDTATAEDNIHYARLREPHGTNLGPIQERKGKLRQAFSHTYKAGDSYWIGPDTYHTITGDIMPLVTLFFRGPRDSDAKNVYILSEDKRELEIDDLDDKTNNSVITDHVQKTKIIQKLENALMSYCKNKLYKK